MEINGSYLEGGGQILRTAAALSAITGKPCHIFNIRKNRPKPGLATQHLVGIKALNQLCNGYLEGAELNSTEIKFYPSPLLVKSGEGFIPGKIAGQLFGRAQSKTLNVKIETAGSITLVLQGLVLPSLFSKNPTKIIFEGGATDTFFSPTMDYFRYVFLKILEEIGAKIEINILKRGFYPSGGANVEVKILPLLRQGFEGQVCRLKNLNLAERGNLKQIKVISGASESLRGKKVAERQSAGVREILGKLKLPTEEKIEYYQTQSPGSQICLIAEFSARGGSASGGENTTFIGTDNLGGLGKPAEEVGKEAALELLKEQKTEACLDKHSADQILPYLALAEGKSHITVSEITNHCKTNIWTIEKFLDGEFKIKGNLMSWEPKTN